MPGGRPSQAILQAKKPKTAAQIAETRRVSGEAGRRAREKFNAGSTQGMARPNYYRTSPSRSVAPVSTLASLPQTPLLQQLIANGTITEGMPPEQALAILAIQGNMQQLPIDINALMEKVKADYAATTGDIETAGANWMQQLYNANMPVDPAMAAMYAQDPTFASYAGGLAQMGETADTNEATDLAWFQKQQQMMMDYYNSLQAGVTSGAMLAPAGGGGGGGGGGGYGGGGGGGGSGGGGDDWSDPRTRATQTEQLRTTDESTANALYPGFQQALVEDPGTTEETAFDLEAFAEGKDPHGVLQYLMGAGNDRQDFFDRVQDISTNNALWLTNLPHKTDQSLATYNAMTGFDPLEGLVPDATALYPGDEEGRIDPAIASNPEVLANFDRLRDLAVAAYDPGEARRTAYEKLFDQRRIQELLGITPEEAEEVPEVAPPSARTSAAYNPLSSARTVGGLVDVNRDTGIPISPSYEDITSGQTINPNNLPLDPNTGMPVGFPTGEAGPTSQDLEPPSTVPSPNSRQEWETLQNQIDREAHTAGGAFNAIYDIDPNNPLRNVRSMLSSPEGRSNLETYFEEGAYQQLPPGQRAAVDTFLQQRGIDTPGGLAERYETRRNDRVTPDPDRTGLSWAETGADNWQDVVNAGRNKSQMLGAIWSNPRLFQNLMATGSDPEGNPIDFESADINRAFAATPTQGGTVRKDLVDILKLWSPTEEERDRATIIDPVTGEPDYRASRIGSEYYQEQEPEEKIEQALREMDFINEDIPIALEYDPLANFVDYKDSSRITAQDTNNVSTSQTTFSPELAFEFNGIGDYDQLMNINDVDPIPETFEFGSGAGGLGDFGTVYRPTTDLLGILPSGGGRGRTKSGSAIRTVSQPKPVKNRSGVNALMSAIRSSRGTTPTRPNTVTKKPVLKKPTATKKKKISGRVRAAVD